MCGVVICRLVFTHPSKIPQKYYKNPSIYLPILQKYLKNTTKILQYIRQSFKNTAIT